MPEIRPFDRLDDQVLQDISEIGHAALRMPLEARLKYLDGCLQWIMIWRNKAEDDLKKRGAGHG